MVLVTEDGRCLSIHMTKQTAVEWWKCVLSGEPEIDTQQVQPPHATLSDLEPETRQNVEKILVTVLFYHCFLNFSRAKTSSVPVVIFLKLCLDSAHLQGFGAWAIVQISSKFSLPNFFPFELAKDGHFRKLVVVPTHGYCQCG